MPRLAKVPSTLGMADRIIPPTGGKCHNLAKVPGIPGMADRVIPATGGDISLILSKLWLHVPSGVEVLTRCKYYVTMY